MGMGTGSSVQNHQPCKWSNYTNKLFRRSSVSSSVMSIGPVDDPRLPSASDNRVRAKGAASSVPNSNKILTAPTEDHGRRQHRESDPSITWERPPNREYNADNTTADSQTSLAVNHTDSAKRSVTSQSERGAPSLTRQAMDAHHHHQQHPSMSHLPQQQQHYQQSQQTIHVPEREDTMSAMSEIEEILAEQIAEKEAAARGSGNRKRGKSCGDITSSITGLNGNQNNSDIAREQRHNTGGSPRAASASISRMRTGNLRPPNIVLQKPDSDGDPMTAEYHQGRLHREWEYRKEPIEGFDIEKFKTANSRTKNDSRTGTRLDHYLPMGVPPTPEEEVPPVIPKRITVAIDNPEYQAKVVAESKLYPSGGINASLLQRLGLASPEVAPDYGHTTLRRSGTQDIRAPTYDPLEEQLIASIEREYSPAVVK